MINHMADQTKISGLALLSGTESFLTDLMESDEMSINGGANSNSNSGRRRRRPPRRRRRAPRRRNSSNS